LVPDSNCHVLRVSTWVQKQVLPSASWNPLLNNTPIANVALIKLIEQINTALCQDYTQLWRAGLRIVCPSIEAVLLLRY
jgi:hypothetical protein